MEKRTAKMNFKREIWTIARYRVYCICVSVYVQKLLTSRRGGRAFPRNAYF